VLNILAGILVVILCIGMLLRGGLDTDTTGISLQEKFHSGTAGASDKVAIVRIEGVIMEGALNYAHKQLEQAGKDDRVKAVVLRINSPGGSITASDDLHRRILDLIDGNSDKKIGKKPVFVSMGSIAASGGYYIAAPAQKIFAEPTTITGSIGVYTTLPNLKDLANNFGVTVETLKAGEIKDAGSFFRHLEPMEKQVLQDMVDEAYDRFLTVVEKGRKTTMNNKEVSLLPRAKLLERFEVKPLRPDPKATRTVPTTPYTRYRADGGIFTGHKAKALSLVDDIGSLEDAVKAAVGAASLSSYRAFEYQKPRALADLLLGVQDRTPPAGLNNLDANHLRAMFTPRMWYLAPGYEAAGLLAAAKQ